jgi:hypothetical protein
MLIIKMSYDLRYNLNALTIPELKKIAKTYNLQERISFSKLSKQDLVEALNEHLNYKLLLEKPIETKKARRKGIRAIKLQSDRPDVTPEAIKGLKDLFSSDKIQEYLNYLTEKAAEARINKQDPSQFIDEYKLFRQALD